MSLAFLILAFSLLTVVSRGEHVPEGAPSDLEVSNATTTTPINVTRVSSIEAATSGENSSNTDGLTALVRAASKNELDIVELLIQQGAGVNERSDNGTTALHLAAVHGNEQVVKYILDTGRAFVIVYDDNMNTPLMLAERGGHTKVAKLLAARIDSDKLIEAAKNGNLDVLKSLVLNGTDMECKDYFGQSALSYAAEYGRLDVVKLLVKSGADIESKDSLSGRTPLMKAVFALKVEIVKYLVDNGAKVDSRDKDGGNPLLLSAYGGQLDIVKCLLEKGRHLLESEDEFGCTPLMLAAMWGHLDVTIYLANNGADANHLSAQGYTGLDYATQQCETDIVNFLRNRTKPRTGQSEPPPECPSQTLF